MNTLPVITRHAKDRINKTLAGLVTFRNVISAVNHYGTFQVGQTAVLVKRLESPVDFIDKSGKRRHGDLILAIVDKRFDQDPGRVCTVMVRESRYSDRSFRAYDQIKEHHAVHAF